jgi:hypothetical protein
MGTKLVSRTMIEEIIRLSETKSQKEIATIYNRTQSGIHQILKRNGIENLKKGRLNMSHLALDVDYFKEINSEEKAYWLGFICADGTITKSNNKVSLISKDLEVIEGFKKSTCAGHKISKISVYDKRTEKTYVSYSIQIGNEIFTQHLINLGVTNNKSNILEFPNIEEKYYSYFIAGLFDGDGSVFSCGKYKNHLGVSLIATIEIIDFIRKYITENLSIEPKYCSRVTENMPNVWKMQIYSDAHKFLDFIYSDNLFEYYLKRKRDMYVANIKNRESVRHYRKVNQYNKEMVLIKTWNSVKEISNELPCPESTLSKYLNHGNKTGFFINCVWRYAE